MIFVMSCSNVQNTAELYCEVSEEAFAEHAGALAKVENEEAIYTGVFLIRQRDAFCNGHLTDG